MNHQLFFGFNII